MRIKLCIVIFCGFHTLEPVTSSLINNIDLPATITSPGNYLVVENLLYAPTSATPAITIATSQVNLNFMNYNLTQINAVLSVTGVQVQANVSGVNISNGNIVNFSQSGLAIQSGCTGFGLTNIAAFACGNRGIELVGTTAAPITEFSLINCNVLNSCITASADNAMTFSNCNDFLIENCTVGGCGSAALTTTLVGYKLTNCQRATLENTATENCQGTFDLRAFSFSSVDAARIIDCQAINLTAAGAGSSCQGFVLESASTNFSCTTNIFDSCLVNDITGTSNCDGFFSGTNSSDNRFINCLAENLKVMDVAGVVSGFRSVASNRNRFVTCYALSVTAANNNTTASPLYAAHGFKFDTTTGAVAQECVARDCNGAPAGRGVGFFWIGTTASVCFRCLADRNFVGFDLDATQVAGPTSNSVIQCFAQKNVNANYNNFGNNSNIVTPPQTLNNANTNSNLMNYGIT